VRRRHIARAEDQCGTGPAVPDGNGAHPVERPQQTSDRRTRAQQDDGFASGCHLRSKDDGVIELSRHRFGGEHIWNSRLGNFLRGVSQGLHDGGIAPAEFLGTTELNGPLGVVRTA
jgi:hypothetical protein